MRNKNSKVAATKLYLCKCDGVCITYSKIQYAYAMKLEKDQSIITQLIFFPKTVRRKLLCLAVFAY